MGLTHYWRRPPSLPQAAFSRAVQDCLKIIPQLGVPLADGSAPAVFSDTLIRFNGVAPQRCESFAVYQYEPAAAPRGGSLSFSKSRGSAETFSFTKTNWLPYDRCVRVALIILRHHLGDRLVVSSDDRAHQAHWDEARALCQEHLGYGREFQLDR